MAQLTTEAGVRLARFEFYIVLMERLCIGASAASGAGQGLARTRMVHGRERRYDLTVAAPIWAEFDCRRRWLLLR